MYKLHTKPTQTRTSQLPNDSRKTNKRVSFSTGVIPTTSVSRPQLKSNPIEDRVMLNNSQGKKQEVEDHRRNVKFSKNKTSVTACNDSLNAKTLNVTFVCATCGKCVLNEKNDMCVLKYHNGVNSRTKMPVDVPVSSRESKHIVEQSVAKPFRQTVALESNQQPRNITWKLYERISKACSWWYLKFTPSGYNWKPKSKIGNVKPNLVEIILFIIESGCSKHMTRNLKLLINFVEKFLGTVKFRNDQIDPILDYGDLVQGAVTIKRVYYVEGLNHNLFFVGQFCDADLEVAFWKSTCYIRDLKGNYLLTEIILFIIESRCSKHMTRNLKLLINFVENFLGTVKFRNDQIDHILDYGDLVQGAITIKRVYYVEGLNHNLFSVGQFCNADLEVAFWKSTCYIRDLKGNYLLTVSRTPEQNGIVKRRNCTLVEAARTMLSAAKVPLFFWAEAIATACFTQNRSLVIPRHEKTPYHIINERRPSVKFFYIFGSLCYIVRDGENLDKMKEKGYSTQSRAYRMFIKRTRVIVETIHVSFNELPQMASYHVSSDLVPECQRTALEHISLSPGPQCQENVSHVAETVVSKYSAVTTADTPNQRQQQNTTPLNTQTTPDPTCQVSTQAPTVTSTENINQVEMIAEIAQVADDEFINIF
nr:hypothetical protein [Tanacetum cinerariifolium]